MKIAPQALSQQMWAKMISRPNLALGCLGAALLAIVAISEAQAVPILHTSDFIADSNRSHFNDFESIPNDGTFFTGGSGPYNGDGISVTQMNGDTGNDIWVTYSWWPGTTGFQWYPNGGDSGYTAISLTGGGAFTDVGFNYGSGFTSSDLTILYELLNDGATVLSGSAFLSGSSVNYLGFSGGGFDTILVRDSFGGGSVRDGSYQALAIDNIETQGSEARGGSAAVPEPSSIALFLAGLAGFAAMRRRKAKA